MNMLYFVLFLISSTVSFPSLSLSPGAKYLLNQAKIKEEGEPESLIEIFTSALVQQVKSTISNKTLNISEECRNEFSNIFLNSTNAKLAEYYTMKLLEDSSKNKNDVTSYEECMRKKYNYNVSKDDEVVYLMSIFDQTKNNTNINVTSITFEQLWFMIGICAPRICNEQEYKEVIYHMVMNNTNFLNLNSTDELEVISIENKERRQPTHYGKIIAEFIPLFFILIFFIIIIFRIIPFCLFKFFFKNSNYEPALEPLNTTSSKHASEGNTEPDLTKSENPINIHNISNLQNTSIMSRQTIKQSGPSSTYIGKTPKKYNKKQFLQFKASMTFAVNGEELFNYNNVAPSKINNDSGLIYIKGIRGICMIFLIFGFLFFDLFNSPVSIYGTKMYAKLLRNFFYPVFFFGLRYSPRILFSCSGYCLFYKLICFLDDNYDNVVEEKVKKVMKRKTVTVKNNGDIDISKSNEEDENEDSSENSDSDSEGPTSLQKENDITKYTQNKRRESDIKWSFFRRFCFYQLYKYILFLLVILFMQFSIDILIDLINNFNSGPMWVYFKNKITYFDPEDFPKALFGVYTMFPIEKKEESYLNYFWMVYCEMLFFFFTSLFLFIGYKFKANSSRFVNGLIVLTVIGKITLFIYECFQSSSTNIIKYQTLFTYYFDSGTTIISPLYNYIYYLIGVFFGTMNYTIQKGMDYKDVDEQEKPFLYIAVKNVKILKKKSRLMIYTIGFIGLLVVILFSNTYPILLNLLLLISPHSRKELYDSFLNSPILNFFLLIDIEIVVVLIHFIAMGFYLKGENFVNNLLSHNFWRIPSKFYYTFILLINPIILYVLYQSETRINFNIANCYLYSIICGILIISVSSLCYIIFELPLKRFTKLIMRRREKIEEEFEEYTKIAPLF